MANFYTQIDHEYGTEAKHSLKMFANLNRKMGNMTTRKDFLIKCRQTGMFPPHITDVFRCVFALFEDNSPYLNELDRQVNRFKRAILNLEIKHTFYKMKQIANSITDTRSNIKRFIPDYESDRFFAKQNAFQQIHQQKRAAQTDRKYRKIMDRSIKSLEQKMPSHNLRAFHNSTMIEVPQPVQLLLSLGSKFALPPPITTPKTFYHLIADIEGIIETTEDEDVKIRNRSAAANKIINHIHTQKNRTRCSPSDKFYKNAIIATKQFLKSDPSIIVLEADKGNVTVMMKREDYDAKMEALIGDQSTYSSLARDPTNGFQTKNNEFAKRLADLKLINRATELKLKTYKATAPCIYGTPKAHKVGLPLRPVVPCMTSPSYELSKYIGRILQASINSKYNVKDSFEFCDFINNVVLPPDHILVSFDVVSLFTCIPRDLVLRNIIYNWDAIKKNTNINLDMFLEIVNFCMSCSYFRFKNKFYQQTYGTAMGNPVSSPIADFVMESLLDNVTRTLDFQIPILRKYVDDLLLALPREHVEQVREKFNQYHPKIQFTVEIESDYRLPYLDLILIRQPDQSIKTEWYRKAIASGRFLNFRSAHNTRLKINTALNFIKRVKIFSTNISPDAALKLIHENLKLNDYPTALINRLVQKANETDTTSQNTQDTPTQHYRSILNIDGLTANIVRSLKTDYPQVRIGTTQQHTIRSLLPVVKDPIQPIDRSNVVYNIPCAGASDRNETCSKVYVGQTSYKLRTRMSKHKCDVTKLNRIIASGSTASDPAIRELRQSAVVEHCFNQGHMFDFDKATVLDSSNKHRRHLEVLEMCYIQSTPNTVNIQNDTDGRAISYGGVFHTLSRTAHKHSSAPVSGYEEETQTTITNCESSG
ncbi:uncharacterized protein LOC129742949 [Uranotaenia lowii]|uniref:uncharacterized protein LOC129742949 n=2 Tax=Uranotaenia lowii TaxID=190385 RepID=UPI0024798DED|nr:uncharacterized protein LOC129742949 [Uranotaenia lowii]